MFPKWMNMLPTLGALGGFGGMVLTIGGFWYYATPSFWEVGYMPTQPGAGFNHQLHAGKLGMDCRYCHTKVEESAEANVPNVATCYGCHAETRLRDWEHHDVQFVRAAYAEDESIEWRRVHRLPDYVRNFPHHVHVQAGVSCYSCHGQIVGMPVVYQAESLSMGWCLDCHRDPAEHMVDPSRVTQLVWVKDHLENRELTDETARRLLDSLRDAPPQNCGSCHH